MEPKKVFSTRSTFFHVHKGQKAATAHKVLCEVPDVDCLTVGTCQNWFKKFRVGVFLLKDDQRSVLLLKLMIKTIIESNHHITVLEVAKQLNVTHTKIKNHVRRLVIIKKLDFWIPHESKEINPIQRINSIMHISKECNRPFLKLIATDVKKCIICNNVN